MNTKFKTEFKTQLADCETRCHVCSASDCINQQLINKGLIQITRIYMRSLQIRLIRWFQWRDSVRMYGCDLIIVDFICSLHLTITRNRCIRFGLISRFTLKTNWNHFFVGPQYQRKFEMKIMNEKRENWRIENVSMLLRLKPKLKSHLSKSAQKLSVCKFASSGHYWINLRQNCWW